MFAETLKIQVNSTLGTWGVHLLTSVLMASAGFVNAIGYRLYYRSTGNMTGLSSNMINEIYDGDVESLLPKQVAQFLSYLGGGVIAGCLINSRSSIRLGEHLYGLALVLCAGFMLIGYTFIALGFDDESGGVGQSFLCIALGLQNGMFAKHFSAVIRTTHVTGTITDVGVLIGHMIARKVMRSACSTSWETALTPHQAKDRVKHIEQENEQLLLLSILLFAFFVGNLIGYGIWDLLFEQSLLIPVCLYFGIGVVQFVLQRQNIAAAKLERKEKADFQLVSGNGAAGQESGAAAAAPASASETWMLGSFPSTPSNQSGSANAGTPASKGGDPLPQVV